MTPRRAAVLSVNSSIKNGKFVNLELDAAIKKYGFEDKDKSFYTCLLYGTIEKKITLDYIIKKLSSTEFEKIEPLILCILETGLYQIFYMDRVPDSAACNEATELVKTMCPKSYAGYVNAILRNAVRQKQKLKSHIESLKGIKGLSVKYSVPEWIVRMWEKDYGCCEDILRALCKETRGMSLRVNTLKISAQDFAAKLPKELNPTVKFGTNVIINKSSNVTKLYGYNEGLFFVQDVSSTLCASLINKDSVKSENPIVIDTCSCPGGKSFCAAINLGENSTVYSFDLHENRLRLVSSGAKRLGIEHLIHTKKCDGRTPEKELFAKADAVICDVPCSGLGVIAKKPDIRYKSFEDIERLPEIQYEILSSSANYVKYGGFIVYSTCTLRRAENQDVVEKFLENHKDFELSSTMLSKDDTSFVTFLPQKSVTDGFFVAKLVKKSKN